MATRPTNNPYGSAEMVDKVIGSAFHTVQLVERHLQFIKHVSINLPGIHAVSDNIDTIDTLLPRLDEIQALIPRLDDVTTVAGISQDITNVAAISDTLATVFSELNSIVSVAANLPIITAIGSKLGDIELVLSKMTSIESMVDALPDLMAVLAEKDAILQAVVDAEAARDQAFQYSQDALANSLGLSLASSAETIAGVIDSKAVTPKGVADAWNAWRDNIQALIMMSKSFEGEAGTDKTYTLDYAAGNVNNVMVWIGGVRQRPLIDYTLSGTTLTILNNPDGLEVDTLIMSATANLSTLDGKSSADFATAAQGLKADTAVQTVNGQNGPDITLNRETLNLDRVDNTSDLEKPISTAVQTALDNKVDINSPLLGSGIPLGMLLAWTGPAARIPESWDQYSGQIALRADYPQYWAKVEAGDLGAVISETAWQADPYARLAFSSGDGSTTFRFPDYNGMQAGSIKGLYLRGYGKTLEPGTIQDDVIRNITGNLAILGGGGSLNSRMVPAELEGAFYLRTTNLPTNKDGFTSTSNTNYQGSAGFDASRIVPTGDENRPVTGSVIWVARTKSASVAPEDPMTLASKGANVFTGTQVMPFLETDAIDVSGGITAQGNVTANAFIGDGSQLLNLPSVVGPAAWKYNHRMSMGNLTLEGIPRDVTEFELHAFHIWRSSNGSGTVTVRIGDAAGIKTSGYTNIEDGPSIRTQRWAAAGGIIRFVNPSGDGRLWYYTVNGNDRGGDGGSIVDRQGYGGYAELTGVLTRFVVVSSGLNGGTFDLRYR